jgi:radical SAM protein with 4Fe4S-binding SPASM domain
MIRRNIFNTIYGSKEYQTSKSLPMPAIVDIEMTNHCNLRCKMCDRQRMSRLRGFMPEHIFCKVVDECQKYKIPLRFIGWGEPFLHPKLIDYLEYAKPLALHVTNNGQIISERNMRDLVKLGLDSIIFSFQGATKKGYEEMRIGSDYDKLIRNINKLIEIRGNKDKPFIHVSSTMTNESRDEISAFVNHWNATVDSVGFGKTNMHDQAGDKDYRPCMEVWHKLTVKWDGQVSACCGDFDNTLVVGNMKDFTLKEIWEGEELKAVRTLLDNNRHRSLTLCKDCVASYHF